MMMENKRTNISKVDNRDQCLECVLRQDILTENSVKIGRKENKGLKLFFLKLLKIV